MSLASGAHVKIGAYEYLIDEAIPNHYAHEFENLYGGDSYITGSRDRTTRTDLVMWQFTDWSGGEGFNVYDPDDPITYLTGKCNPREVGEITAPPSITNATGLPTFSATPYRVVLHVNGGDLWIGGSRQLAYSGTGTSFTAHPSNPIGSAGNQVTALASDGTNLFVAVHSSPSSGTGTRTIYKASTSTITTMVSSVSNVLPFFDMNVYEGKLYGWTGRNLVAYPTNPASLPITHDSSKHIVTPIWDEAVPATISKFKAAMTSGEQSLFMMWSTTGKTEVFEWRKDEFAPIWSLPLGFRARDLAVANGVLYVVGDYEDEGSIWGMSLSSRNPIFVGSLEPVGSETVDTAAVAAGPGYQLLVGDRRDASDATVYIYDAEADSVTRLDDLSAWGDLGDVITFRKYRIAAGNNGTTAKCRAWQSDKNPSGSWEWISPRWDLGYPFADKSLQGFHIVAEPLPASGTVQVYYQDDEDGTWTLAGTLSGTGNTSAYLAVSDSTTTVKFKQMRVRMVGANAAKVFSLTCRSQVLDTTESWTLALRLKDEQTATNARPVHRLEPAETLRTNLETLIANKDIVTFLDGYKYKRPGDFSTHSVTVEYPTDFIERLAEGTATVRLRAIDP